MADDNPTKLIRPKRTASLSRFSNSQVYAKREIRKKLRKVTNILKKNEDERTEDEISTLDQLPEIVKAAEKNAKRKLQQKERILEIEDEPDVLEKKCKQLAEMLQSSKKAIVYTGAGISTAASIPDYRGPNGVWTLLRKGQSLCAQDLVDAEPTYTHMCITKLFKEKQVKYLVSQNCDGLHIRSGFPRHSLSEVHGNMFIEICKSCKPQKEHIRLFDVTERTGKGRHRTGRTCHKCGSSLYDSIIHFGEKSNFRSPYKWRQAAKAASESDLIICLGSSLKVLRCYPCLWRMNLRPENRPKLVIINLQWTPKDDCSALKIHGRCDDVLKRVAHHLKVVVPQYRKDVDPLFKLQTPVKKGEEFITSKKWLEMFDEKPVQAQQPSHSRLSPSRTPSHTQATAVCQPAYQPQLLPFGAASYPHLANVTGPLGCHTQKKKKKPLASSTNGHILGPVRWKLEQMLKSRGVGSQVTKKAVEGMADPSEKGLSRTAQHLPQAAWSGMQDIIPPSVADVSELQNTHPHLHTLLRTLPHQFLAQKDQEQEVFRVDLSTNPVSITSTHCYPTPANPVPNYFTFDNAHTSISGDSGAKMDRSSNSMYTHLVHKIFLEHSYCKLISSRYCASETEQPLVMNSQVDSLYPCLLQHVGCDSSEQHAVPQFFHPPDASFSISNPDILCALQQAVTTIPGREDHHLLRQPLASCGDNVSQDRLVFSLNTAAEIHPQPANLSSTMQNKDQASLIGLYPPPSATVSGGVEHAGRQGEATAENKCKADNSNIPVKRKKMASIPGWFGKGLRIRQKKSL